MLSPAEPAHSVRLAGVAFAAQESFQGISWMYPRADSLPTPLVGDQKLLCVVKSSKSVPPTAILKGVDAKPDTARPPEAGAGLVKSSHAADPLSPADMVTVIPWAAACSHNSLNVAFPVLPKLDSHSPKLRLITSSELRSITYSAPMMIGSDVSVSSDST